MTKNIKLSTITTIAVFSIIGCGSSSSSETKIGTSFYGDAAVSGLGFECGKEVGTTDVDGKFTFEVGKPCTFKIGAIELPVVEASELKDGVPFVEDDNKTTQFLQSLDNANDGRITITPALIKVLEAKDIVTIPNDEELKVLTTELATEAQDNEAFTFTGAYVTPEAAAAYVQGTKDDVAGEAAAVGMKFTFPSNFYHDIKKDYYERDNYVFEAEKFSFSKDKKFSSSVLVFKDDKFVLHEEANNDNSEDYTLKNGEWVKEEERSEIKTVISKNDTVATLNDMYQLTFNKVKNLENKSIKLIDSNIEVKMPKDAKEIHLGFKILKEIYEIYGQAYNYNSLSEVVKVQCGTHYFTHAKDDSDIRGISFTCNQESQTSGTLVGVKYDNKLVEGVGTWEIKNLPNSKIKALLINIDNKYNEQDSDSSPMYALKDGEVWVGYFVPAAERNPIIVYNQKAFNAISAEIKKSMNGESSSKTLNE